MKFNSKHIFLWIVILFFGWIIVSDCFSLSREGLDINEKDVSGTQIPINASISDKNLMLLEKPQTPIHTGDFLLTNNGVLIKSISGNPISIENGDGLTFSLSDTPNDVTFNTITEYIIFGVNHDETESETNSKQYKINGVIDTSMNFTLSSKPDLDFTPGTKLLFANGENVKDDSKNSITIVSGSGLLYQLSGLADPDYNLYDTPIDYMVVFPSSPSASL